MAKRTKQTGGPSLDVERLRLDREGYVASGQAYGGRYFGVGEKLWRVTDRDGTLDEIVRAGSKTEAKAKVLRSALHALSRVGAREEKRGGAPKSKDA